MTEIPFDPQAGFDPGRDDQALYAELLGQTAKIEWSELERFFAKGQVVRVDAAIDLVDVAMAMVRDRAEAFGAWQAAGRVAPLDIETARRWAGGEPTLWAVVTPPWILVQEADQWPTGD
jgi:hypothetical protein